MTGNSIEQCSQISMTAGCTEYSSDISGNEPDSPEDVHLGLLIFNDKPDQRFSGIDQKLGRGITPCSNTEIAIMK